MQLFTATFILNKDYLAECYDQSLPHGNNTKNSFALPIVLFAAGVGLLGFTGQPKIFGSMLIAIAVVELIHIRYKRAWWLARQILGRSSNSEVTLTIDADGIRTKNSYTQTVLLWADITRVVETDLGLILVDKSGGQQYLSKSLFSIELINDIVAIITE
jgi:hypothetical protein